MTETAGIIGLGIMGGAFARNLLAAGWDVVGHDLSDTARAAFTAAGGRVAANPSAVAAAASRILLSLPSVGALEAVVSGPDGLASVTGRSLTVACTSTLPLSAKEAARDALAAAGHVMLDTPVSGTGAQAQQKDVVVLGSGPEAAFDAMRPVLEGMSRRQVYAGAFGAGIQLKIIANHLVTIHNVAAAEAMAFAAKLGLDLQTTYDALYDGAGSSRMFQVRGPQMVRGVYEPPTATIKTHLKDLHIIDEAAEASTMPLPVYASAAQIYRAAQALGFGGLDTASVCAAIEVSVGIQRDATGTPTKSGGQP
jgi:L-threonate 2-dehydrogenase